MLTCATHRRYKAARPPRSNCARCAAVWEQAQRAGRLAAMKLEQDRLHEQMADGLARLGEKQNAWRQRMYAGARFVQREIHGQLVTVTVLPPSGVDLPTRNG